MVTELAAKGLTNSTAIIMMAKHGETSLDPSKRFVESTSAIQKVLNLAGLTGFPAPPAVAPAIAKLTQKTTAFLWLKDQTQTASVVNVLTTGANETTLNIGADSERRIVEVVVPGPALRPGAAGCRNCPEPGHHL